MAACTLSRAVVPLLASAIVPGLQLAHDVADDAGGWRAADPRTVTAVDGDGDGLVLTFDGGLRLPFAADDQVDMVCAPTDHPTWCAAVAECEAARDVDGTILHTSDYRSVEAANAATGRPEELVISLSRCDDPDGEQGPTSVYVMSAERLGCELRLPPAAARELAALLLEAADRAEPEHDMAAAEVRVGDQLRTADGWETVTGLLADGLRHEVAIFTDDDTDVDEAMRPDLDAPVRIRRAVAR